MIIEKSTMNILFYLGIILPTIITVILFVLFIICWFRIKTRRDILTKKHDPHGKMRQLGMSLVPPPPPIFVRHQFRRLTVYEHGEDNNAYQVSRSPSTEQEQGGARSGFYHAPHDSGLSELSEFQSKDRPNSQASQGSTTDSEDSGFRSSRSGQYNPNNNNSNQLQDTPLLKSLKGNNKNGSLSVRMPPPSDKTVQSQWPTGQKSAARTLNTSGRKTNNSSRDVVDSQNFPETHRSSVKHLNNTSLRGAHPKTTMGAYPSEMNQPHIDLTDISTHVSWMYLQNLASSTPTAAVHQRCAPHPAAVTTAQIHSLNTGSMMESNGDLLGYSVV